MYYKDRILSHVADRACKKVSAKIVRGLQKITDSMLSGDDTPLKSTWGEICVQMKVEQSFYWDAYEDTIFENDRV